VRPWLRDLLLQKLEQPLAPEVDVLDRIRTFTNQSQLLPHNTRLDEISSDGIFFIDGNGEKIEHADLSDGCRAMLSLTYDILRQLILCFGADRVFDPQDPSKVVPPGVIMIDEVDAHLHPSWQRRIGKWFCEHFPNMQFIVATHSPLVCQSAQKGSIWLLPEPGTDDTVRRAEGTVLDRLLYGDILDAYGTGFFGDSVTRSDEGRRKLERLAELNQKERHHGLSAEEEEEQRQLRAAMPTREASTTPTGG
jgi:hypothetical protein